jgi:hypothetical protein
MPMNLIRKHEACRIERTEAKLIQERYFQAIGNLGDKGALRKEAEKFLADVEGKRRDKDAERDHLGSEEHEGERVAVKG